MIKFNNPYHDPHRNGVEKRIKEIDKESYRIYMLKKLYSLSDYEVEELIEK